MILKEGPCLKKWKWLFCFQAVFVAHFKVPRLFKMWCFDSPKIVPRGKLLSPNFGLSAKNICWGIGKCWFEENKNWSQGQTNGLQVKIWMEWPIFFIVRNTVTCWQDCQLQTSGTFHFSPSTPQISKFADFFFFFYTTHRIPPYLALRWPHRIFFCSESSFGGGGRSSSSS